MGADKIEKGGGKTPPKITTGTFVSWKGGSGRVNMVVTSGKVPGVDGDVTGTTASPAVRVAVWQRTGGTWSPTRQQVAMMAASLKRIAPLTGPAASRKSAADDLIALQGIHQQAAQEEGAPDYTVPAADAVKAVFERGVAAWPGQEKAGLDADDWALSRVAAFLELAAGADRGGYRRDTDLLPDTHPLRQTP